ncbi:hypothetical protein ECP03052936_5046, partial [Escherichia coli p0305293.6]
MVLRSCNSSLFSLTLTQCFLSKLSDNLLLFI